MEPLEVIAHAKALMGKQEFAKALKPLLSIDEKGLSKEYLEAKYILISSCYFNMSDYPEALSWANKATQLNKASEFASVCKCNSYRRMNQYQKAFSEMKAFISVNPPLIYRAIVSEFLADIAAGKIQDSALIEDISLVAKEMDLLPQ